MNAYITLENSNASLSKRFRVLRDGYSRMTVKSGSRRITTTGKTDNQTGPSKTQWHMNLYVYETDPVGSAYGTLANLRTFFGYDDPAATPSNVISLTDFDDNGFSVYLMGSMEEQNLGSASSGVCAIYMVPIDLVETT